MATLLHKRFYGGILLSNTVFSMSVMLLLGASGRIRRNICNETGCLPSAKSSEAGFEYVVTSAPSPSRQVRFLDQVPHSPSVAPIL